MVRFLGARPPGTRPTRQTPALAKPRRAGDVAFAVSMPTQKAKKRADKASPGPQKFFQEMAPSLNTKEGRRQRDIRHKSEKTMHEDLRERGEQKRRSSRRRRRVRSLGIFAIDDVTKRRRLCAKPSRLELSRLSRLSRP